MNNFGVNSKKKSDGSQNFVPFLLIFFNFKTNIIHDIHISIPLPILIKNTKVSMVLLEKYAVVTMVSFVFMI